MESLLIMHTGFAVSTVLIFMILFIGTAGIMMPIYMTRFITLHGILHHGLMAGDGDTAGIHPIIAGAGVIHPGTAHTMQATTEAFTEATTVVITAVIHGMVMEAVDTLTLKTTVTDNVVLPAQVLFTEIITKEDRQPQQYAVLPTQQKVHVKEYLPSAEAIRFQVPGFQVIQSRHHRGLHQTVML